MDKDHAKTIPISEILDKLNIKPVRVNKNKALYFSPIRKEKTPSFWVYLDSNSWYDFGVALGGDGIEFANHYLKYNKENYTMVDALRWIGNMSGGNFIVPSQSMIKNADYEEPALLIKSKEPIRYIGLVHYLEKRGVPLTVANKCMKQLRIQNKATGKSFLTLGFKNVNEGYELRNPFFKGCIKPKTISFIRGKNPNLGGIHIFEGFMDYVSVITILNDNGLDGDTIVLNSIACLNMAIPYIRNYGYKTAYTWMDNDPEGGVATETFHAFFKTQQDLQHIKMNKIYAPYKDVNAWHMHTNNLVL